MSNCLTCRYWRINSDGAELPGSCQRLAPVASPQDGKAIWPATGPYAWCGQHEWLALRRMRQERLEAVNAARIQNAP